MADQFYMARLIVRAVDGERLGLFQIGQVDQELAENAAKRLYAKCEKIVSVVETDPDRFAAAYKENEKKYPGRLSTHELTGGKPNKLLMKPHLAEGRGY